MALFSFLRRRVFWTWVLFTLAPSLLVVVLLCTVQAVSRWTRSGLSGNDRFQVAFADIECTPPAALSAHDFLDEVKYLSGTPERIDLLAKELPLALSVAFRRHPWVEGVERVELLPGRKVRVQLVLRTPVLAVRQAGQKRAINSQGILLPATASTTDLPLYCSPVPPPQGTPGMEWGDPSLKSAAQTIVFLYEQPEMKQLTLVETSVTGLILTTALGSRVLWGQPADGHSSHLAAARKKRDLLVRHCQTHGNLDEPEGPREHDLRWLDAPRAVTSGTAPSRRD